MISPRIARALRERGHDVQATKGDRPDLESTPDLAIVRRVRDEQRAIVTNDIDDFQPIHNRFLAAGEQHYGIIFTSDASLPRNKASIPLWLETLGALLEATPGEEALRSRVRYLL